MPLEILVIMYVGVAVAYVLWGIFSAYKGILHKTFLYLCLCLALWSVTQGLMLLESNVHAAVYYLNILTLFHFLFYAFALYFVASISSYFEKASTIVSLKRRKLLIIVVVFLPAIIAIINGMVIHPWTISALIRIKTGWVLDGHLAVRFFYEGRLFLFLLYGLVVYIVLLLLYPIKDNFFSSKHTTLAVSICVGYIVIVDVVFSHYIFLLPDFLLPPLTPFFLTAVVGYIYSRRNTISFNPWQRELLSELVFEKMQDAVMLVNSQLRIKYVNQVFLRMFELKSEVLNLPMNILLGNQIPSSECQEEFTKTVEIIGAEAEVKYMLLSYVPKFDELDRYLGGMFVFKDISLIAEDYAGLKKQYDQLDSEITRKNMQLTQANENMYNHSVLKAVLGDQYIEASFIDTVTGMPNIVRFSESMNKLFRRAADPIAFFYIDLVKFRSINDAWGYPFGDEVLRQMAKRIEEYVGDEKFLCRITGDDFVFVLQDVTTPQAAQKAGKEIVNKLEQKFAINGRDIELSVVIGAAFYPEDGKDVEALIRSSNIAMYMTKSSDDEQICFYNAGVETQVETDFLLTNEIRKATKQQEFVAFFQPQIHVGHDGKSKIIGYEALARWNHPRKGMLSARQFIDNAERSGAISDISYSLLEQSCEVINTLRDGGYKNFKIAVNLSTKQLHEPKFLSRVSDILSKTGIDTAFLELEITESSLLNQAELTIAMLHGLKRLGVQLSVDDFGTGYSSLNYLKMLPLDKLKIDKSFIDLIDADSRSDAILKTIIELANNMGVDVIAEGVENKEQLDFLLDHNCFNIQGFYFYRPLSFDDIMTQHILPGA